MFGFISKKKLIEVAVDTYYKNHSDNDMSMEEFRFQCGVANGLGYLCSRFGIDLTKEVRKDKRSADITTGFINPKRVKGQVCYNCYKDFLGNRRKFLR